MANGDALVGDRWALLQCVVGYFPPHEIEAAREWLLCPGDK
jgi:hypothetical protein